MPTGRAYDADLWDCINALAAGLGLSGRDAVARVSDHPDERWAFRMPVALRNPGCIAWIAWTGTDDRDVSQPADAWNGTPARCHTERGAPPMRPRHFCAVLRRRSATSTPET